MPEDHAEGFRHGYGQGLAGFFMTRFMTRFFINTLNMVLILFIKMKQKKPQTLDFTRKSLNLRLSFSRAIDGTRTRDFHLGKVALYQLSHYRI